MQKPELKGPSWCHERVHPFDPASLFPLKSLTWGERRLPFWSAECSTESGTRLRIMPFLFQLKTKDAESNR